MKGGVRITQTFRDLARDERGAIMIMVAIFIALFLGMVALSFDTGRAAASQTELQSYADTVALAAAGELDREADAIVRAEIAAAELIVDEVTFASGGKTRLVYDPSDAGASDLILTFLTSLPPSDTDDLSPFVTTDPEDARFVHASVRPRTVDTAFANVIGLFTGNERHDYRISAAAVAGIESYACDITPLMFCIPPADATTSPPTKWTADNKIGQLIKLRTGGLGAAWTPGEFGFLDPVTNLGLVDPLGPCAGLNKNSAQFYRCIIGVDRGITGCVSQDGVDFLTGQRNGQVSAFNTRFDIYEQPLQSMKTDPAWAPAPNVLKGMVARNGSNPAPNSCIGANGALPSGAEALPLDTCFENGTCTRFGNSSTGNPNWRDGAADPYLATNHDGADPRLSAQYSGLANPHMQANPAWIGTRWEMYLAEIERAQALSSPTASPPVYEPMLQTANPAVMETGLPVCSTQPPALPERRLVVAAAIDCNPPNDYSGRETGVKPEEYVLFFMTRPVSNYGTTSPPLVDIWVEVLGSVGGTGGGSNPTAQFRDVVQLYR